MTFSLRITTYTIVAALLKKQLQSKLFMRNSISISKRLLHTSSFALIINYFDGFIKQSNFLIMAADGFFLRVYEVTKLIPFGRVTSYGAIAKYLGAARSARMVGWALNASHLDDSIPAHRVVNRKGLLSGKHHFKGSNLMQQLLENENIKVENNHIIEFKKCYWDPNIELIRQ